MKNFKDLLKYCYKGDQINFKKCNNIGLAFLKLIKEEIIKPKGPKKDFLDSFVQFARYNKFEYEQFIKRIDTQIDELKKQGYRLIFKDSLKTQSRLIIGLGSYHPLETSITLHHIFGIPYIPGTALKGVCRMSVFWKLAQEKKNINLTNFQNQFYGNRNSEDSKTLKYQFLFGAQDFKGLLVFLDAYPNIPDDGKVFDLDIMNVHYPEYYSGDEPPTDWQNPNPIFFLTIKEGISFHFSILFDEYKFNHELDEETKKEIGLNNLDEEIAHIITEALKEFGIGAKTRLGYGIF